MPQKRFEIYIPDKFYVVYNLCTRKTSSDGFGVQVLTIFEATSWHVVQPDSSTGMLRGRNAAAKNVAIVSRDA